MASSHLYYYFSSELDETQALKYKKKLINYGLINCESVVTKLYRLFFFSYCSMIYIVNNEWVPPLFFFLVFFPPSFFFKVLRTVASSAENAFIVAVVLI